MGDPIRLSVAELADGAAHAPLLDPAGRVRDPLMAVEISADTDAPTLDRAVARAHVCDRLLVGVVPCGVEGPMPASYAGLLAAFDLTLAGAGTRARSESIAVQDPEGRLRALHAAVTRNPQASLLLGGVLRATEAMPVTAACRSFQRIGDQASAHVVSDRPARQPAG